MPGARPDGSPVTPRRISLDLESIGVEPGMTLMVHCSLRSLGWVLGGAATVVDCLVRALGKRGTLVMPAATPQCLDPAMWAGEPVPPEQLDLVRDHFPLFDAEVTPTALGAVPETFRNWPGTIRSRHPLESVCANGPEAGGITGSHPLEFSEGHDGPFGRLHDLDCRILLIGVGFDRCTALHYAESLVERRRTMIVRFARMDGGRREWVEARNVADDNGRIFPAIGERFETAGRCRHGRIGRAASRLFPMRDLVAAAVGHFNEVL